MSTDPTAACRVCAQDFNATDRSPCVGSCGHSICYVCTNQNITRCPVCNVDGTFKSPKLNFQLLENLHRFYAMQQDFSVKQSETQYRLEELTASNADIQKEKEDVVHQVETLAQKLRVAEIELETKKTQSKDIRCCECGYAVAERRSILCVTCASPHLVKVSEDGTVSVINFEETERNLLCGGCVLYGDHAKHETTPYLALKLGQCSAQLFSALTAKLSGSVSGGTLLGNEFVHAEKVGRDMLEAIDGARLATLSMSNWEQFLCVSHQISAMVNEAVVSHSSIVSTLARYAGSIEKLTSEIRKLSVVVTDAPRKDKNGGGDEEDRPVPPPRDRSMLDE